MIAETATTRGPSARLLLQARRSFSSPLLPPLVAALALLLSLPTVRLGFMWDDLIQRTMLQSVADSSHTVSNPWQPAGEPATPARVILNLFRFAGPDINAHLQDLGIVPWWTYDRLKIALFRPLSALTHWLDFQMWGDHPEPMHLENIFLYALACLLAARLFRRFESTLRVAGLAAFIFAVDDRHIIAVAWLANRNSLLALIFGVLAIICHDRWRREQWSPGAFLAPLWFAFSAAATELGIATGAYLLGHIIFLDRGSRRARVAALLPYLAVGVVWYLFFHGMDFGAYGSGLYVSPAEEPLRFAGALLRHGPIMLGGQILAPDPLPYFLLSAPMQTLYWVVSVVLLISLGVRGWRLMGGDRAAGFWGTGMVLSAALVSGINVTTGRPLLFASLGAAVLIAKFIWLTVEGSSPLFRRKYTALIVRLFCAWLVFLHVIFSPLHFALRTVSDSPPLFELEPALLFSSPGPARGKDLVVVNAPNTFAFMYFTSLRGLRQEPVPARVRLLAPGTTPVTVQRLDSSTVLIRPTAGYLVPPGSTIGDPGGKLPLSHQAYYLQNYDETYRSPEFPMRLHEKVEVTGMSVEVASVTDDGRPATARIRFAEALESGRSDWVMWDWTRRMYVPFRPPAIGESVTVAGPAAEMPLGVELFGGK